ncbi:MAG: VCBS repeat-containing protein [Actinomycetota bacterium]|nr:VCBS repeat-containing protein [Actinomycetota bacterium]
MAVLLSSGTQARLTRRLAGLLIGSLGLGVWLASPASAAVGVSPAPDFPTTVTVGQTFPAAINLSNTSTPPESTQPVTITEITLVSACIAGGPGCTGGVDPGVFQLSATATGAAGTQCAGTTFNITEVTSGVFRFSPVTAVVLTAGGTCRINFTAKALKPPSSDADPASPGIQGTMIVSAKATSTSGAVAMSNGSDQVTVLRGVVADFDGDLKTDFSVFRPSTGAWLIQQSGGGGNLSVNFGTSGDVPVPGDYNGDGVTDIAVYRPSTGQWFVRNGATVSWGTTGDIPIPGDYDANGTTDIAVYRPSTGQWFVRGLFTVSWGTAGDIPVPADYNGNGTTDLAVYRPSNGTWYVRNLASPVAWGAAGDIPVPGDYDGNGVADIAVFRPSTGTWFVYNGPTTAWGTNGDIPVPGDYDGNGATDLAVYRPSSGGWFVKNLASATWGTSGDKPLPLPSAIRDVYFP